MADPAGRWEQRWHPFRREWVVYSAHRSGRPWIGASAPPPASAPAHDPACYLCPGGVRVGGARNPDYPGVFVFDNDHPVVGPLAPPVTSRDGDVFQRRQASGLARVICFSPRHNAHWADFTPDHAGGVMLALRAQTGGLARLPGVASVLYFENRGEITGTSNPHPHGQFYATTFVFTHVARELEACREQPRLFADWIHREREEDLRVVGENEFALAILPFFARYPHEVWLLPKAERSRLADCTEEEAAGLGRLHRELCVRYDRLHDQPFPYVASLYEAPVGADAPGYRLHFTFLPPLRAAGLQKFPAGPEIGGGNFMNDTMPEEKAAELRRTRP